MSQISAAALPAGTEQLALVAAFDQGADNTRASGLGVAAILLEHESEMLPDELGPRNSSLLRRAGEERVHPLARWLCVAGRPRVPG